MASDHQRNLSGMHDAPRCEGATASGHSCGAPAVTGTAYCHHHGGSAAEARSYGRQFGDYAKANLEREKRINSEVRNLGKLVLALKRCGTPPELVADGEAIRRRLLMITQQKEAGLAASYTVFPGDFEPAEEPAAIYPVVTSDVATDHRSPEKIRDRAIGAMVGLVTGEAMGVTMDGFKKDAHREREDMYGGGRLGLKRGQWGTDTAMARALLDSLRSTHRLDEMDLMMRFAEVEEHGAYTCTGKCLQIDEPIKESLARFRRTSNPIAGDPHPDSLGNGSLVRVAPVAIRYWNDPERRRDAAARQSRTTHADPSTVALCIVLSDILADAIAGESCDRILGARRARRGPAGELLSSASWRTKGRDEIESNAKAHTSFEAAMWAVYSTISVEGAVIKAANLAGDSGTITALTGQLAGALYGASSIRREWIEQLALHDEIAKEAEALFEQSLQAGPKR